MENLQKKEKKTTVLRSTFFINTMYGFLAQGISLLTTAVIVLGVPKIIGVEEFSYWQLFLFYSGYSGFFHFGLNDGIYLKEGGKNYSSLDKRILGGQLKVSFVFHCMIALLIVLFTNFFVEDSQRSMVLMATAIILPLLNATAFIGYVFQAVNQTKIYSISIVFEKLFFIAIFCAILIGSSIDLFNLLILYVGSKVVSFLYCLWIGRKLIFSEILSFKTIINEIRVNITIGSKLLISNISGLLILGNSRFFIERIWGISAFGAVSYSILLANFFLVFISQISMVLFPVLRQITIEKLTEIYGVIRNILGILLASILLAYMPLYHILNKWIPEYQESLLYLALLLPLITYDGKMNLLCNTYFKVMRKENFLMKVNFFSLALSSILSIIGGYIFGSINFIIVSMLVSIAIRSLISEIYLAKMMKRSIYKDLSLETILIIIFILPTWYINPYVGFYIYLIVFLLYILIKFADIKKTFSFFANKV